jgi:hypothetical protein
MAARECLFNILRAVIAQSVSAGLRAGRSGFQGSIPGGGWEFFPSPPRPERL